MNDKHDDLLHRLGEVARAEESESAHWDERWDRLAAGTLTVEEEGELRALAGTSEEAGLAYEAFRPLGPQFHAAVATAIAAQAAKAGELQMAAPPSERGRADSGGRVLPFPRTVRQLAAWGAGLGAATAATVAILVRMAAPLPVYSMADLSGGHRTTRGELVEAPRFAPGDRFQTVLTPTTEVDRASSLRTEACVQQGDDLRRLEVKSEIDDTSGAVRVSGTLDRELPAGDWTLWLIVGRKGSLPDLAAVKTFTSTAPVRERNWVALPKTLLIQPRAPD